MQFNWELFFVSFVAALIAVPVVDYLAVRVGAGTLIAAGS